MSGFRIRPIKFLLAVSLFVFAMQAQANPVNLPQADQRIFEQVASIIAAELDQMRGAIVTFLIGLSQESLNNYSDYRAALNEIENGRDPLMTSMSIVATGYLMTHLAAQMPNAGFKLIEAEKGHWLKRSHFYIYSKSLNILIFPTYKNFLLPIHQPLDGWGNLESAPSVYLGNPRGFINAVQERSPEREPRDYRLKELLLPVLPELFIEGNGPTVCESKLTPTVH